MRGRNKSGRFANLGYALIRADQQFLCVFASDMMMIGKRRVPRMPLEGPEQIASVDKQRIGHFLQREFVCPVLLHVLDRGVCQRFAAGFFSGRHEAPFPAFFQTGTFFPQ